MKYSKNVHFTQLCLSVSLFGVFLTPNIKLMSGLPALRLDDLAPVFWIAMMAFYSQKLVRLDSQRIGVLFALLVLLVVLPISIMAGSIGGYGNSLGDLNQYLRLIKYALIYLMAAEFINRTSDMLWLFRRVAVLGIWLAALATTQYFDVLGLNVLYIPITAPTQFLTLVNGYPVPRVVGMTGGPNELAILFAVASLSSFYGYSRYGGKLFLLAWAMCFVGVGMTGSRTGIAAGGAGMATLIVLYVLPYLKIKALAVPIIIGAIGAYMASQFVSIGFLLSRFLELSTLSESASWNARVSNWEVNMKMVSENIFLGVGPLSRAGLGAADNDWLLILRSYGSLGIAAVGWIIFGQNMMRRRGPARSMAWALAVLSGVAMIPGSVFHSLIAMPLILVLFAGLDKRENRKLS